MRRNHLKPESLETLFLLSVLKMPIKSVTSYQAEIKYLEEAKLSFDFWILQLYINISTIKCFFISLLEIKSFVSLKNECLLFWMRVHFKGGGGEGGVKFSKNIRGVAHKGGSLTDLD